MGLTKFNRTAQEVQNGQCVKELFGKYFLMSTPPTPTLRDGGFELPSDAQKIPVYTDDNGIYWINHQADSKPSAQACSGFGLGRDAKFDSAPTPLNIAPPPAPLTPWAGRDSKPMPPSPLLTHKQTKHIDVDTGKGASRKMTFGNTDVGQKHISDFFNSSVIDTIAPMDF